MPIVQLLSWKIQKMAQRMLQYTSTRSEALFVLWQQWLDEFIKPTPLIHPVMQTWERLEIEKEKLRWYRVKMSMQP